jgi:hypothetical protein
MSTASSQPSDEPLIPMPPLTFPGLRQAVLTLGPSKLRELFEDMQQAFIWAEEEQSLAPIRIFHIKWGTWVAIERWPARAARFHECERLVAQAEEAAGRRAAAIEIGAILAEAEREITG